MIPLEAPRTIEDILQVNKINIDEFSKCMTDYVQTHIASPSALAKMDFSEHWPTKNICLGNIATLLVNETLGERRSEFSGSEYSLATFIELTTLLFGGLKERKMGMIEQNHPFSTAYNIMLKGGSKIEFYAAMLHDFVENKAENDIERKKSIIELHDTLNRFVDLHAAKEEREHLKAGNTKIAIIIDLLTQKRDIYYGNNSGEEHYDDFISRITMLPRDKKTLEFYKELGLFEQIKDEYSADYILSLIQRWSWDETHYDSLWITKSNSPIKFFIQEITLPAMNIKLEDRRDNTIKVDAFKSKSRSLTPAKQNRSNNAKNLIYTIPKFRRYLDNINDKGFDTGLTYRLMNDLRQTTSAQIDKTINEKIFSNNTPEIDSHLRRKMIEFRIATSLYTLSRGFEKSTVSGETKLPWYIPTWLVPAKIISYFHDLDNIASEYAAFDRKLKPTPTSERKEKSLQHLIAFRKLAQLLGRGLMPYYHHTQNYIAAYSGTKKMK